MTESKKASEFSRPSIVDVVFHVSQGSRLWYLALGLAIALAAHGGLFFLSSHSGHPLESWAKSLDDKVHHELTKGIVVDTPAPPPEPPQKVEPPKAAPKRVATQKSASPAKAASIIAKAADAPVDLTGEAFVTGTAEAYAGGVTASNGSSDKPVVAVDESQPVSMGERDWACPWPKEAETEELQEQTVVIKVLVRVDGSVQSTNVLKDPGHGFAEAAIACAQQTQFVPARDPNGTVVEAMSPPIRVRFTR